MKHLAVLGSTGSIGHSTLSLCESFPDRFRPLTLAAGHNLEAAFAQAIRWRPTLLSVATEELAADLRSRLHAAGHTDTEVLHGTAGTIAVATHPQVDFVVSAIVGVAGLEATYAAILAGKQIGLANKECLVAAGELLIAAARLHAVNLLPIDSEHNAIHQCLRGGRSSEVRQIWLTASGGPFRSTPLAALRPHHPRPGPQPPHLGQMGRRITIDSATMMNKGFEVIEACRLFALPPAQVRVTVHPQSTVHSLVEFIDGSILAQISVTDMRLPILYALAFPDRVAAPSPPPKPPPSSSTSPPSPTSTSPRPTSSASPACASPTRPPRRVAPPASPSTPPTRSPSTPSSKVASPSSASRVQSSRC